MLLPNPRLENISKMKIPAIMGILNITPDSFYDGGKFLDDTYLSHTEQMIKAGASIIDIGAASTRPGSTQPTPDEELKRLEKPLAKIRQSFPETIISIDTFHSGVVEMVYQMGADMINDISAGTYDPDMFSTISKLNLPYILMHIKGNPASMQVEPVYSDLIGEIKQYFDQRLTLLNQNGHSAFVAIDPGFGFGKTVVHNFQLLKNLSKFKDFGVPIVVGLSRKSMIYKVLGNNPESALNGTTALNTIALLNHADILRVHDVKEAVETLKLINIYKECNIIDD